MLNVCFSESAMNGLKFAIYRDVLRYSQIICLPDDLSIGDISDVRDFNKRRGVLTSLISNEKYIDIRCKEIYDSFFHEIYKHKSITIWYSNIPQEFCGFLFVLWLLKEEPIDIKAVCCSRTIEKEENVFITYNSVGEIDTEEFSLFLPFIYNVTEGDKEKYIALWERLSCENGSLRIFKNSSMITVEESYYDEIILKYITSMPNMIARVIGEILQNEKLGIADGFIKRRIQELINRGILVQEGSNSKFCRNNIRRDFTE